ncbi:hypothetical protein SDC9_179759 [bioreactor metagenome]|uniref:Uncharacterized protein n=1 Tax=bioreactor metagenome TaxID=1076179 RepID=A0A645GZQ3_9ZZZZ
MSLRNLLPGARKADLREFFVLGGEQALRRDAERETAVERDGNFGFVPAQHICGEREPAGFVRHVEAEGFAVLVEPQ